MKILQRREARNRACSANNWLRAIGAHGSLTTGPIPPGKSVTMTFDKPGSYVYVSKTHPWVYGELTVE